MVICTEKHKKEEDAYHYHAAIWNENASKHTATKRLREAFHEWDGRSLNVTFHKSLATMYAYVIKEDKNPLIWGDMTMKPYYR